jgi:hypothetical protein
MAFFNAFLSVFPFPCFPAISMERLQPHLLKPSTSMWTDWVAVTSAQIDIVSPSILQYRSSLACDAHCRDFISRQLFSGYLIYHALQCKIIASTI